ncbi:MAG: hypothetical protein IKH98_04705, partial [Candidatus Methanomethylophilaceae archaeon]|nr:hypothetical protein [Candidatus Methanomethylophilaceae archaeon]
MMVMVPGEGYGSVPDGVRGKRVLIWTCNTCARLCGVGGGERAEETAHSTVVATVDSDGLPVTCVIDMMYADENGLYFLTAKGKN